MIFGIISFPGTNCETESARALQKAGFKTKIIRWNEKKDSFLECQGFLIAGGFSYEDRIRSGAIAAKCSVMKLLQELAQEGYPIIGICNGAQILVENGLICDHETAQISLSFNKRIKNNNLQGTGFYHSWCYLKNNNIAKTPFNNFKKIIKMPLAHGEGRFIIPPNILQDLYQNQQVIFQYSLETGEINSEYPVNPNGSIDNIAGMCNKEGNVLAIMPHPERAGNLSEDIFTSLYQWCLDNKHANKYQINKNTSKINIEEKNQNNTTIFIQTMITDNTEESANTLLSHELNTEINLKRFRSFDISFITNLPESEILSEIEKMIESDLILNTNKEKIFVQIQDNTWTYLQRQWIKTEKIKQEHEEFINVYLKDKFFMQDLKQQLQDQHIDINDLTINTSWLSPKNISQPIIETGVLANLTSEKYAI